MPLRKFVVVLLGVIWLILFSAVTSSPQTSPANGQDNRLSIVATTTIAADVLQNIAGDAADVSALMQAGQDPHTYQPSGNDIILLDDADLVFINGANYEEGLISVIEEAAGDNIFEISTCVEILAFGGNDHDEEHTEENPDLNDAMATNDSHFAEICDVHHAELEAIIDAEVDSDHNDETLGPLYTLDCGEGHGHEAGSCDPHTWGDIHNVMLWTFFARDTLSELDPANVTTYAANAAVYLEALHELDTELKDLVETVPIENRLLITNHASFSYLAHSYDFEVIATVIPAATTAAEPSATDVVALIEIIEDSGISAIFTENVMSDDVAQQIAEETDTNVYQLYSEALTAADGAAPTYIAFMRYNITTIVGALLQ